MTTPDPADVHTGTDRVDPRDAGAVADAARWLRESDGSYATEIAGVRMEKCDDYGATATTLQREGLARELNAVKRERDEWKREHKRQRASHAATMNDLVQVGAERDALQATLDRVTANLRSIEGWSHAGLFHTACAGTPSNIHWTRPGQLEAKCNVCGFSLVAHDAGGKAIRAALTPEGKDRADRVDAEDGGR